MIDRAFWQDKEVVISISVARFNRAVDLRFLPGKEYGQISRIISNALNILQDDFAQATHAPTRS
jgi:hypothetical protein